MINVIYEDVNSEEYLAEMATVNPKISRDKLEVSFKVHPDMNHIGNPYFKVYNNANYSKATKVARFSFNKPYLIRNHKERNGKKEWLLSELNNNNILSKIIDYLNMSSELNPNITVWTLLKYYWNSEKGLVDDLDKYISGYYDKEINSPNYIPYNKQIPDYLNIR